MANELVTNSRVNARIRGSNSPLSYTNGQISQGFINYIILDPQKRFYTIIGVTVVAVLLTIFHMGAQLKNKNTGKLVTLVQKLNQSKAFEIMAKLKSVNIEAKVINGEKPREYSVQVHEKAIETASLTLSKTNLLEEYEGYSLFDQNDWAASDYDKRIKLIRAINGDLSKIISRLDGLKTAIVRVNIPEQQLLTEQQGSPTATVQLELANDGEKLSKTQTKSIVNIIRGYIQNIKEDHISIVDTEGNNYSNYEEDPELDIEDT